MERYLPLGAMKLTTQKFYRVSGDSTQYRGVVPDVVLPDRQQHNKFGERYLDHSLPWDTIGSVPHADWPKGVGDVPTLLARSSKRVAGNPQFDEIQRVAETLAVRLKNTRQSLQIDTVVRERNEIESGKYPHGDIMENDGGKGERKPGESDQMRLVREVREDPYAQEAMAILDDLLGQLADKNIAGK
jgi:carboxyl-terminal processing protease